MSLDVSATVTVVGTSLSIARASPLVFLPHGRVARVKPPAAQPQPPVIVGACTYCAQRQPHSSPDFERLVERGTHDEGGIHPPCH